MVGNKIDLDGDRKISKQEATQFASQYKMNYVETSAKNNIGVNSMFETLINDVFKSKFS